MNQNIGFTTMTFKTVLQAGEVTLPQLFAWGEEKGFGWVEVRDFELSFSEAELLKIKAEAKRHGLRVHYAWDTTSVYKAEDRERIFQGIRNAGFFGNGTCSRIVIAPELMNAAKGKKGYTTDEFQTLERNIRDYIAYAEEHGVILVFENSLEPLGRFEDFLAAVPAMRMTFDTANTFNKANTGEPLSWAELKAFTIRRKEQIPYVHLKSFKNEETQMELIADGEVPLAELLPLLKKDAYLCVELPADGSLSSCVTRVEKGLALVRELL